MSALNARTVSSSPPLSLSSSLCAVAPQQTDREGIERKERQRRGRQLSFGPHAAHTGGSERRLMCACGDTRAPDLVKV